jgi:hypothetical protein
VSLQPSLFGESLRAERVRGLKTTFRFHRCPRGVVADQAFSAGGRRKQRPGGA